MEGGGGMGKKLRLRFSRVLPSFNSRRSNINPNPNPNPNPKPNPRQVDLPPPPPSASLRLAPVVSTGCCCAPRRLSGRRSDADLSRARETPTYLWRKEASALPTLQNHLDSDNSSIFFPPPPGNPRRRRDPEARRRRSGSAAGAVSGKKKKPSRSFRSRTRNSTSSGDSGWFSSEDDEREGVAGGAGGASDDDGDETDTLLSSFEADSSGVIKAGAAVAACCPSPETGSPEAGPEKVLRRMASGLADVMVTESFAVVKQSEDPHGDFRRSMAEMVLEKQIYDAAGLEQLLHCFLSINSRHHHQAIVAAFADIWDAIFPKSPSKDA